MRGGGGLPPPRGRITELLFAELEMGARALAPVRSIEDDALVGDDLHLALAVCYALHTRGIDGVDGRWEWEPSLLAFRAELEAAFEHALFEEVGPVRVNGRAPASALGELVRFGAEHRLEQYLDRVGTEQQRRELALHRRALPRGGEDPRAFALPRLPRAARAPMVDLLTSNDARERLAAPPAGPGDETPAVTDPLDDPESEPGVDRLPGATLAAANLAALFGLHRRWRGAAVGHLALDELRSPTPNRGAVNDLVGALLDAEPMLAADVLFGGRAQIALERRFVDRILSAWSCGRSSLLLPD